MRSSLSGLVEKFQVLGNEPLANALDGRLRDLNNATARSKNAISWAPEALSFLLLLSDRPAEKTRLEDLEEDGEPDFKQPVLPSWQEMLEEDGENECDLWQDVDFRGGSEDEDEETDLSKGSAPKTESTAPSSEGEEDAQLALDALVIAPDSTPLDSLNEAQSWRNHDSRALKINVPELYVIRESLYMLLGLPSILYEQDPRNGKLVPMPQYSMEQCSQRAFQDALQHFAKVANTIKSLRSYSSQRQEKPLRQRFASCIFYAINNFDNCLQGLERRYVGVIGPVVVSLLDFEEEVTARSSFLLSLHSLLSKSSSRIEKQPYALLDAVYEAALDAQSIGHDLFFPAYGKMLFRCLETYLKPIRQWMESGELDFDEHDDFPITIREGHMQLSTFWQDRFYLRQNHNGCGENTWLAPRFLQYALPKILASGKSVAFMRELGIAERPHETPRETELELSFSTLYPPNLVELWLVPFETAFDAALTGWIRSKLQHTSSLLRSHILHECRLLRTIDALETVYMSKDAGLFGEFAAEIFTRLENGKGTPASNGFALEDAAKSIFSSEEYVEASAISVYLDDSEIPASARKRRGTIATLERVKLQYHVSPLSSLHHLLQNNSVLNTHPSHARLMTLQLPWPLANILPPSTLTVTQQSLNTLLLQLHHAKTFLTIPTRRLSQPTTTNAYTLETQRAHLQLHIRHRLLHILHILSDHITHSVLLPSYQNLIRMLTGDPSHEADPQSHSDGIDALAHALRTRHDILRAGAFLVDEARTARSCVVGICELAAAFAEVVGSSRKDKGKNVGADVRELRRMRRQLGELVALLGAEVRGLGRWGNKGMGGWDWEGVGDRLEWKGER